MRVLVIGGTNFIGPYVVRRLADVGHDVTVFHRGQTVADLPDGVDEVRGDRGHLADFADDFGNFAPDVVLDMVPMNEREARSLMETFRNIAGRAVAISSQDVYLAYDIARGLHPGPPDPVPLDEDAPLRERLYPYEREEVEDYEKILVERAVMSGSELPATVLRLPAVYGPGDYMHRLFRFVKRMDDGRPAILLGEGEARWRWTHGYVEDIADAIALTVTNERATGRTYNVGEEEPLSTADLVREIGRVVGWEGEILAVPKDRLPEHLDLGLETNQHLVTDTSRIRRELGYAEAVSREEALRWTVAWERANPPRNLDPAEFDYAAEDAALS